MANKFFDFIQYLRFAVCMNILGNEFSYHKLAYLYEHSYLNNNVRSQCEAEPRAGF